MTYPTRGSGFYGVVKWISDTTASAGHFHPHHA